MKPYLNKALLRMVVAAGLVLPACADYQGGEILNEDVTYSGSIHIDYAEAVTGGRGGVAFRGVTDEDGVVVQEAPSGLTVILHGNVLIDAGKDVQASTEVRYNNGIYLSTGSTNCTVKLQTASDADSVTINTYGRAAAGISNNSATGTVEVDVAGYANDTLRINGLNLLGGKGIWSMGNTQVNGNLDIRFAGGAADAGYVGVRVEGGTTTVSGNLNVDVSGSGVWASGGGSAVVNGSLSVVSSKDSAIYANGASTSVMLNGGVSRLAAAEGKFAINCASGALVKGRGRFTFSGTVYANDGAVVELDMSGASSYTGYTRFGSGGLAGNTINLSLTNASIWTVTGNSSISALSLDGTSSLAFNLLDGEAMTFANIYASSVVLAEGTVLKLLGVRSSDVEASAFSVTGQSVALFNAASLTDAGAILVTEDNYVLKFSSEGNGSYTITGVTDVVIPEPGTAVLGLFGMASVILRRRRASISITI